MNGPSEEERFITNVRDLTALIHDLSTICWNAGIKEVNPQLILFAESYLESFDSSKLIDIFIRSEEKSIKERKYSLWERIRIHDEKFFAENAHVVFQDLPVDSKNINAFKVFFTSKNSKGENVIEDDDRNAIWNIFESLVKICIKYVHRVRGVTLVKTEEGLAPRYIENKYPEIKVRKLAKLWNIELPIPEN